MKALINTYVSEYEGQAEIVTASLSDDELLRQARSYVAENNWLPDAPPDISMQHLSSRLLEEKGEGLYILHLPLAEDLKQLFLNLIRELHACNPSSALISHLHGILDGQQKFHSEHERLAAWAALENPPST
jgi:hypothetical protein